LGVFGTGDPEFEVQKLTDRFERLRLAGRVQLGGKLGICKRDRKARSRVPVRIQIHSTRSMTRSPGTIQRSCSGQQTTPRSNEPILFRMFHSHRRKTYDTHTPVATTVTKHRGRLPEAAQKGKHLHPRRRNTTRQLTSFRTITAITGFFDRCHTLHFDLRI